MPRVICNLPNAGHEIDGIPFTEDRGQMISAEIDQPTAERLASIPGFVLVKPAAPSGQAGGTDSGEKTGEPQMSPAEKRKATLAAKAAAHAPANQPDGAQPSAGQEGDDSGAETGTEEGGTGA